MRLLPVQFREGASEHLTPGDQRDRVATLIRALADGNLETPDDLEKER
jgi:hypothetical protein